MFKTPDKHSVTIMGTEVEIIIDDDRCHNEEADGLYSAYTVTLKSEYDDIKHYRRVYAHECFHALCDILGAQLDLHTEEILAHRVSVMITEEI